MASVAREPTLLESRLRGSVGAIGPVDHKAVRELVVEQIRRAIHIGCFLPGDKLPPERELARQLAVSRTTVRDAVRVLEGEGYVETRRGAAGGIVVLDEAQSEERLAAMVHDRLAELRQIIEFRLAVECRAARLAAKHRTAKDIERLEAAYAIMQERGETRRFRAADSAPKRLHRGDPRRAPPPDSAFHLGIAEAAGNAWMRTAIEDARVAVWVPVDSRFSNWIEIAQEHHAQILAAVRARDADAAEAATAAHMRKALKHLYRIAAVK
jgi:GntR family transcriptional repressor for pyruvate dehydrogenase complex